MTITDAIKKIKVMLAAEVETVSETFAETSLVDGTVVYTEGELVEGAVLYVRVSEGEDTFAPAAVHETVDGMLVTVGENGVIEKIEEKATEVVASEDEKKEEEVMSQQFNADNLLVAIAEMIKEYQSEVAEITEEFTALKERFNAVAGEPAAKPVKHNFGAEAKSAKEQELSRIERLASLRNKK